MFSDYGVPVIDGNIDYIAGYLIGRNKSLEYQAPEEVIAQDQFKISVATLTETIDFALRRNPEAIHQLSPRQFEEFIAELMEKSGYEVTLTRASRDNGVDIYAVKADSFGRFLTVVDCKKYRADRTIGIEVVRGMMAVLHIENASHAMLATTSSFSSVARNFEREHRFAISLKDHADILDWSTGHNRT
jgi:restriction system protein